MGLGVVPYSIMDIDVDLGEDTIHAEQTAKRLALQQVFAKHPIYNRPAPTPKDFVEAFDEAVSDSFDYFAVGDDGKPLYELSKDCENGSVRSELIKFFNFANKVLKGK